MACVDGEPDDESGESAETGISLIVDYDDKNDVVGIRYDIKHVPCANSKENFDPYWVIKDKDKALKDLTLPGGISTFINRPLAEDSSHQFGDFLTLLKPGCYDIYVQPMKKLGTHDSPAEISKDCPTKVSKKGVRVVKGKTTEVLLISQCKGGKKGALDIVAALNHPPKIIDLDYKSTHRLKCKYGAEEVEVKVCARAVDKDGDPMNFYWGQKWGPELGDDQPVLNYSEHYKNKKKECVTYTLPGPQEGQITYMFKLSVFDKFVDKYGDLVHAEDWINDTFYKGEKVVKSRHHVKFPIRLICKDEDKLVLENSASATADEDDINPENNTDTASVSVKGSKKYCGYSGGAQ